MIFTFGTGHTCLCGRPLTNCYTRLQDVAGAGARERMFQYWGTKWSHQYEDQAGEEAALKWSMECVETNTDDDTCPCGDAKLAAGAGKEALEYERWLVTLEPDMQAIARKYPLPWCYRSTDNPLWHFTIGSFGREAETGNISCTLVHGADSTLPGVGTFGQRFEQLIPCRCGQWKPPTKEQIAVTRARLEARYGKLQDGGGCVAEDCDHDHHH